MKVFELIFLFVCIFKSICSYDILAIFPHEGRSHHNVFAPVIRRLASGGHNMTVIGYYSFKVENEHFREIILEDTMKQGEYFFDLKSFVDVPWSISQAMIPFVLTDLGVRSCQVMLSNSKIQNLLKQNIKFDLILAEFFNSECIHIFKYQFDVPLVGISASTIMPWHNDRFGNPDNPSYIPNNHLWHQMKMNFFERVENVLGLYWHNIFYWILTMKNQNKIESFSERRLPLNHAKISNTSLLLANSHFSLTYPRPLVPGVIEVGGIHIEDKKMLPWNIEKFINESTHGVIYFSLGSMIKGHTFPQEKKEEFLRAFARLPQRVLWKWENETMPGKPDNVMIQKWMPQFDILSHPNVKAFISHGGLLGVTEAVHCGVPMIVMPQYGDQHTNAKAVEANGGGVILYLREATEEKVYQNLKTILDPEFRSKAKALSERFRDRPMSPMDTAIYWIEYVARHKGAPHMRTAAVDMPLYQYLLLDVFAFLAVVLIIFLYVSYKISSLILRAIFSKKKLKQN